MKYKLFTYILLISLSVQAQEFAPIGAIWHYEVVNGAGQQRSFLKWSVDGDTIINNLNYRKIKRNQFLAFLLREEGSKVYWYNSLTSADRIFFDRNPNISDIWHYPYDGIFDIYFPYSGNFSNPIDSISLRVESLTDTSFNGLPAKKIEFSKRISTSEEFAILPSYFKSAYLAYSPFGFFQTLFLLGSGDILDTQFPIKLRCYEDDYWGLISIVDSVACDSSWLTTSINKINDIGFELFPNPASNLLNIQIKENQGNVFQMDIVDLQGRKVLSKQIITSMNVQVSISNLKSGMYFINIEQGRRSTTKKFTVLN